MPHFIRYFDNKKYTRLHLVLQRPYLSWNYKIDTHPLKSLTKTNMTILLLYMKTAVDFDFRLTWSFKKKVEYESFSFIILT